MLDERDPLNQVTEDPSICYVMHRNSDMRSSLARNQDHTRRRHPLQRAANYCELRGRFWLGTGNSHVFAKCNSKVVNDYLCVFQDSAWGFFER